jgi:hypothetical protein
MKFLLNTILISILLLFFACKGKTPVEKYEHQMEELYGKNWKAEVEKLKNAPPTFYKPSSYDDCWRGNSPYLEGAEGWIGEKCSNDICGDGKIVVTRQELGHKGWGKYEGDISFRCIDNNKTGQIDFNCFLPDYDVGKWICKGN